MTEDTAWMSERWSKQPNVMETITADVSGLDDGDLLTVFLLFTQAAVRGFLPPAVCRVLGELAVQVDDVSKYRDMAARTVIGEWLDDLVAGMEAAGDVRGDG